MSIYTTKIKSCELHNLDSEVQGISIRTHIFLLHDGTRINKTEKRIDICVEGCYRMLEEFNNPGNNIFDINYIDEDKYNEKITSECVVCNEIITGMAISIIFNSEEFTIHSECEENFRDKLEEIFDNNRDQLITDNL
jgi:hypothetical protein